MSEVSLDAESGKTSAEDPQMDNKEADGAQESLSEGVDQESVDTSRDEDDGNEEMYDVDIDSAEERSVNSDKNVQKEDEGVQSEGAVADRDDDASEQMSDSVDKGEHETNHHVERAEAPEESGDSHTETKVIFNFALDNQPLLVLPAELLLMLLFWVLICCDVGGGGLFPVIIYRSNLVVNLLDIFNVNMSCSFQSVEFVLSFHLCSCVSDFILLRWRF